MTYHIHVTDVGAYKSCRQAWWWQSNLGMNLERKSPVLPFATGTAFHGGLQAKYEGQGDSVDVFDKIMSDIRLKADADLGGMWAGEDVKFQEQIDLGKAMLNHYEMWQANQGDDVTNRDSNLTWIATELHDTVPLFDDASNYVYDFRFDGVVQRKSDQTYWLFESKTCRSIEERKSMLANDEQSAMYMWAAEQKLGIHISGVLYNLARKKMPTVAPQLKQAIQIGDLLIQPLSQDKSCDTSFEYYKAQLDHIAVTALARAGHDAAFEFDPLRKTLYEYHEKMLASLWEKGNKFFERYELAKTRRQIERVVAGVRVVALEMTDPNLPIYTNGGKPECLRCHFRAPCLLLSSGSDPAPLLAVEYQQRHNWDERDDAAAAA